MIVPYLRGYGTTRFLSSETFRNAQQFNLPYSCFSSANSLKSEKYLFNRLATARPWASQDADLQEDKVMAEPTLYERLGGIFAIAAVIDNFSDRLVKNPRIVNANPELHEWHTVTYHTRMPGLKWGRTLWVAMKAGGPFEYTGLEMRDAHFDLKISPEVFDEVTQELINAMDDFKVPEREKAEVLAAFGAEKGEVTAGSEPGAVNWRRWR